MKRRTRYPDKVIAFAMTERSRGARWKEVTESVVRQFGIKPPTERQMRKWYKEFGGSSDPERLLRENLIKVARATTPIAAFTAQKYAMEQVPNLVEAWREGKDPWVAGGVMILSMLEETAGTEVFGKILEEYQKMRRGKLSAGMGEPGSDATSSLQPRLAENKLTSDETEGRRKP